MSLTSDRLGRRLENGSAPTCMRDTCSYGSVTIGCAYAAIEFAVSPCRTSGLAHVVEPPIVFATLSRKFEPCVVERAAPVHHLGNAHHYAGCGRQDLRSQEQERRQGPKDCSASKAIHRCDRSKEIWVCLPPGVHGVHCFQTYSVATAAQLSDGHTNPFADSQYRSHEHRCAVLPPLPCACQTQACTCCLCA